MKRIFLILTILSLFLSLRSNSQDKTVLDTTRIKPALLVIDIQKVYLNMIPENNKKLGLAYINALIELFHNNDCPVIRIYHHNSEFGPEPGEEQFEFPSEVSIKPEDPKIIKTYGDGFNKTDLDKVLKEEGSNTLFLCGLSAVGCVLATWIGAQDFDYKAFMVKDAIMSHNSTYTDNIEQMFDAVSYDVVKLLVETSAK
jgi:nicotinamidase-related amidase